MSELNKTVIGLQRRNFLYFIVYVIIYCYVIGKGYTADIPQECAFRTSKSGTAESTELFCRIRTINNLDQLIKNISFSIRTHDYVLALHVLCNEVFYFESTLKTNENSTTVQTNLRMLRDLVVDKCKIRQLPARAFEKFKDLKTLRITTQNSRWSSTPMEIHENAFFGLSELVVLNLGENNIWNTKIDTFCPLYSLKTLNITSNHLQNLKDLGFSETMRQQNLSLKSCNLDIKVLDLSHNDFIVITDNGLSKLRSLSKLFLQHNDISLIEKNAFEGLTKLNVLNLSCNFINSLPSDIFSNSKSLNEIYLNNNTINALPPGLFEGLHFLQILDISKNRLSCKWIDNNTFAGLFRLVILDLSYNKLGKIIRNIFEDVFALQKLNLEFNEIVSIEDHSFEGLRNLHSLALTGNKLIHIRSNLFTDLHILHNLFLDKNTIKHIDDNSFDNMTFIEDLVLNDNSLSTIPLSIRKLRSLRTLDVGKNNITHLSHEHFNGLNELYGLRLVDNKITHIFEDIFQNLPHLQILNLASNKIVYIAPDCFRRNPKLRVLCLDDNEIAKFDNTFTGMNSLIWLNMSYNKISSFDFSSFPKSLEWLGLQMNQIKLFHNSNTNVIMNIKILDLSYNNITNLTATSLPSSIEKLLINNNNINYVEVDTFALMKRLSRVYLNNNNIMQLDMNAFRLIHLDEDVDLPEFFISGNPLFCDCFMEWLQRINGITHGRQYPRILDLDKTYCTLLHSRTTPRKIVLDMTPNDFLCPYDSHCYTLCHCCEFVACDCEMICPYHCKCYHDIIWHANVVDCSNAGYTTVPNTIPMDATEIYLDGNEISHLNSHVFIGKKKLQVLYLNNTRLKEVNNQSFKGIESLGILRLENNELQELKGNEFTHFTDLKELYLDHNSISHIANETFSSLSSLSVLTINSNKLIDFYPWKALSSKSKTLPHISMEENQYSCDCESMSELELWLRDNSGDPEKMLCADNDGNPTTITIASAISHCKGGGGSMNGFSNGHLFFMSLFFPNKFLTVACTVIIIVVVILLIGAIFYAFRYNISSWLYTHYGIFLFKEQPFPNDQHVVEGNPNHMYDYYVICNTKDIQFIHKNIMSELEIRKMSVKKLSINELSFNVLTLDSFSKSSKLNKRLLIVLTTSFLCHDLCDMNFKNLFYTFLKALNPNDLNKVIFIKVLDNNQINDDLCFVLETFKNISWHDPRFWDKFTGLLNSTDTIITVKKSKRGLFKKSKRPTPVLKYTTMTVTNDTCPQQNFCNSSPPTIKKCTIEFSNNENSSTSNNACGGGNNSNNSYVSIENKPCPRFNYDLRVSPATGHIYSRVDDISAAHARAALGMPDKSRTYYV